MELEAQPLPGHERDAGAYFIAAFPSEMSVDIRARFAAGKALPLSEFFRRYVGIAVRSKETVLPYEVTAKSGESR